MIRIAVGALLLLNTVISPIFIPTTDAEVVNSGFGKFNASLVDGVDPDQIVLSLLIQTGSFLLDNADIITFRPFNPACESSGGDCFSVVLPGSLPSGLNISPDHKNDGIVYIVENAPGLQLDFYTGPQLLFQEPDCRIYATGTTALAVCLKNVNDSLSFGIHPKV